MKDARQMTPSQIGNRICASGMMDLGQFVQSELQELEYLRKECARLSAKVRLLEEQLPEEAKAKAAAKLHEAWLKYQRRGSGSRRAPAISDG
jgi:hypothetical protein